MPPPQRAPQGPPPPQNRQPPPVNRQPPPNRQPQRRDGPQMEGLDFNHISDMPSKYPRDELPENLERNM